MVLGISVAIFLNEIRNKLATRFYQSVMLVPFLISWVVVSYLVYAFLAPDTGFINNSVLKAAGNSPISWYTEPKYWPFILVFVNTWKSIGFNCVFYYSSLISINTDYYEAATIDGANKWQQIKSITPSPFPLRKLSPAPRPTSWRKSSRNRHGRRARCWWPLMWTPTTSIPIFW